MSKIPASVAVPTLESVLTTAEELDRRPCRPPDFDRENRALVFLAQALANSPPAVLQALTETILTTLRCGSAGISLLTGDGMRFHWPAIAGAWKPYIGGGTPRDFGPCGDVLDRDCPLLFKHPERRYTYLQPASPPIEECLLVPFYVHGIAVGTIWAVAHDGRRKFDNEDLRVLKNLGTFTSAAYQAVEQFRVFREQADERLDAAQELREMNDALMVSSAHQHELAEHLRESERRRQLALDSAELGSWHIDPLTMTLTTDKRFRAIFGTTGDRLDYESAIATIHPEDQVRVRDAVAASLHPSNPAPYAIEYRVIHRDGSIHWVFSKGRANFGTRGLERNIDSFDGTAVDVTDQKISEEALRESEERFQLMAETMPQKIFTANAMGDVTYFNPQWILFTGMSFEKIKGWGWTQIIHPDDIKENIRVWQDSIDTGKPFLFEHRFRQADGQYRWHITRALPMRDARGQIIMWVGSNTDVDDGKRIDEAIRNRLEDEVTSRTASLLATNEQLQGFTYSVAHDLRQQIRGISTNASILMLDSHEKLDPESNRTLSRLVDSSAKLAKLVDDLLTYARLGRQKPNSVDFDLTAMTEEVAALMVQRGNSGQAIQFDIARGLRAVGDPLLVRIVIENLLDNACKYSSEIERPVIRAGRKGKAFFIRDNGIGFDMRFKDKLFLPFERLHSDPTYSGNGIGLANVKRIVEKHGGKVWAEAKPGKGATFYFSLA